MAVSVIVLSLVTLVLASCGASSLFSNRAKDFVAGFRSAVAGDEPQSVLVAEQVLSSGGSAADAAVAAYFAMAVSLPSAASLGGGGVCLVTDATKREDKDKDKRPQVEVLVFTHAGGTKAAAPANVRAMLALHAKYGELSWQRLLAPAESMARFGITVSKAMAKRLEDQEARVKASPGLRLIFTRPGGELLRAGDRLRQIDLSTTLSSIRRAPRRFFRGDGARRLAAAYQAAGVPLTAAAIEAQRPEWQAPVNVVRGNQAASFPPTPAGVAAAQMWAALYRQGHWRSAGDEDRPHVVAEVSKRVYARSGGAFFRPERVVAGAQDAVSDATIERLMAGFKEDVATPVTPAPGLGRAAMADRGSATIVAADRLGVAVACAFTLNRSFGAAKLVPRTGIVMAAPPDAAGGPAPALSLMALRQESQNQLEYLGAATGGAAAPVALVTAALEVLVEDLALEPVQNRVRVLHSGVPDRVAVEDRRGAADIAKRLRAKGHRVDIVGPLGRLNAFICPRGFDGPESRCEVRTDPRGLGFAEGK
ncbi:MAG: gamma-glutamyltransferase family protein [Alphaproteobacteria bacterium]|nr:gamma-glutamyltransferase family protein [Alphaproteobacteria bacterium]